jgi:hypothetical protein
MGGGELLLQLCMVGTIVGAGVVVAYGLDIGAVNVACFV